jgi:hypothetical protein
MEHSFERDMKDAKWFVDKVRTSESYAQNVYAALCNNAFQKLELMPVLKDEVWTCTWRYAGGLVADIRCEGDYMDWYCSGIRDIGIYPPYDKDNELSEQQRTDTDTASQYVSESTITEEIRDDFKKLGWIVVEDYYDDDI